jgi:hypothetical protein
MPTMARMNVTVKNAPHTMPMIPSSFRWEYGASSSCFCAWRTSGSRDPVAFSAPITLCASIRVNGFLAPAGIRPMAHLVV